jgi:hypothetical protein
MSGAGHPTGTTTTNGSGNYSFTGLTPGDYYVVFVLPSGYTFSSANAGGDAVDSDADSDGITGVYPLASGTNDTSADAGMWRGATVGGQMWEDTNANGLQEPPGEPYMRGLCGQVTLYDGSGPVGNPLPIDSSGTYSFTDITPGDYHLEFLCAIPGGMGFSPSNVGEDDTIDSDGITTDTFPLTSGEVDMTWDLGWYDSVLIMAAPAWEDLNLNATVDPPAESLSPILGATAALYTGGGSLINANLNFGSGYELAPGSYYIQYTLPGGYAFVGTTGPNNDVDVTGRTVTFTLKSGESFGAVAAAYMP